MACLLAPSYYLAMSPTGDEAKPTTEAVARAAYGKLPLRFEPNRGQTDSQVRFLSRGAGYSLFLTQKEAVLSLTKHQPGSPGSDSSSARAAREGESLTATVRIRPVGANPNARLSAAKRQVGHSNYLTGSDPSKWQKGVPGYGQVSYRDIYPGIDLVYRGSQRKLEYDFVVAPGADPDRIALQMKGARKLSLDSRGDLVLRTGAGTVRQRRPLIYQRIGKTRRQVKGRYVLHGTDRVGFSLGAYDRGKPLVIDPVLAYSTYLGGGGDDQLAAVAVANGCTSNCESYVTGSTTSLDFPTKNARQSSFAGGLGRGDAFVAKLNASGSALVYATYLGGSALDGGDDIAVDGSGSAYVTGQTGSGGTQCDVGNLGGCNTPTPFPTTGQIQGFGGGVYDAFVTKLDPSGSTLSYSTFLGGIGDDQGYAIAVARACPSNCEAYLTGQTYSLNFPLVNPFQLVLNGGPSRAGDGFVSKLNASGSALAYSTYLGGTEADFGFGIAADASGNAYVTGSTKSGDFHAKQAYDGALSGSEDAFLTKLNAAGSGLVYSTYLGGDDIERPGKVAIDTAGSAYVVGRTTSANFPTKGAYQSARSGPSDAFVTKLEPSGSSVAYSTYLGGNDSEEASDVALAPDQSAYVTGQTTSTNFPTKSAYQDVRRAGPDAFVTKLNPTGSELVYSSYLGGDALERPGSIAVDATGNAHVAGTTYSSNFPSENAYQSANRGQADTFLTKFSPLADLSLTMTAAPNPVDVGAQLTYTLTTRNLGLEEVGANIRDALPAGVEFVSAPGCAQAAGVVTCEVGLLASGASAQRQITVRPTVANPALSNTASVQGGADPQDTNNSATVTTEVRQAAASVPGGGGLPTAAPAPTGAGDSFALAAALARERARARALAACLARVARHTRRENLLARSGSAVARRFARRHARSHARVLRGRCLRRHGRTPGRVTGLSASAIARKELVLSFRAPGSNRQSLPPARSYLVKQSTTPITDLRGFRAVQSLCGGVCRFPLTRVGEQVKLRITGLRPRTNYYYAIAARDNVSRRLGPRSSAIRTRTR